MENLPWIVAQVVVLFFSITIHECAHAYVAYLKGDPTAKAMGRISLNPLHHLDPFGTVIFPALLIFMHSPIVFGWAKPVLVNPLNLKNPIKDNALIALAGPGSNIVAAMVGFILLKFSLLFLPLEGLVTFLWIFLMINLILAVFNLIPIPPLDGSSLLYALLSPKGRDAFHRFQPFGIILLIGVLMTGIFDRIIHALMLFIRLWL